MKKVLKVIGNIITSFLLIILVAILILAIYTFIELDIKEKGEQIALNEMRKHIAWYTKNMKDASFFRNEINHINNKDDLMKKIKDYFKDINH